MPILYMHFWLCLHFSYAILQAIYDIGIYFVGYRLAKCHHPHHPSWCKGFRVWVKCVTEHTVFCCKFNLLSQFCIFWWVKLLGNVKSITFSDLIVYFKGILIILSLSHCTFLHLLLCRNFGIAKNYALFLGKLFSLKCGWCKENDILHVWSGKS